MGSLRRISLLAIPAVSALAIALGGASTGAALGSPGPSAHAADGPTCRDPGFISPHRAGRRRNPLALPVTPPAADPLRGARFTVAGPYIPVRGNVQGRVVDRPGGYSYAGSEIVRILGLTGSVGPNGAITPSTTWTQFESDLATGRFHQSLLDASPGVRREVNALALLASQPTPNKITAHIGSVQEIETQTTKVMCFIAGSDPGSIPIIVTYFLHPELSNNATRAQILRFLNGSDGPGGQPGKFQQQIQAVARGIGNRQAVVLAEIDGLGSSMGFVRNHGQAALDAYESALKYEINTFEGLPRTAVYVEGGYSDSNSPSYTARALNAVGINNIQGFFTNDTHQQWTSHEVVWARRVINILHNNYHINNGLHFIVNTSDNGRGPRFNPFPMQQGVEDNCNPASTGIGIPPTTITRIRDLDAYLWTHPPGTSAGNCVTLPRDTGFRPQSLGGNGALVEDQRALCNRHGVTRSNNPNENDPSIRSCVLRTFPNSAGRQVGPTANGAFWPQLAVSMVSRANAQFGPRCNWRVARTGPMGCQTPALPPANASLAQRLGQHNRQNRGNARSAGASSRPYANAVPHLDRSPPVIPTPPSAPQPPANIR